MLNVQQVVAELRKKAHPNQLAGMARFGIVGEKRLGVKMPDLRALGKTLGKDHALALSLWKTGIPEARSLASLVDEPEKLTAKQMDAWIKDFNSWDVCDQVCQNLFEKSPLAWSKIKQWSTRENEFEKRAAFALLACLAWHDKKAGDADFVRMLPLLVKGSVDERNFVKKAVNWALRNIGKRSPKLNAAALETACKIQKLDSKAARWIAADAIRELSSAAVQKRFQGK